ncbi:MAG: hypothetical protein KA184_07650 [Candidatus Hydrogenedentes bacterium]|nr:hypothetical protein [Candidatus Hydrogenedentota bacterium]
MKVRIRRPGCLVAATGTVLLSFALGVIAGRFDVLSADVRVSVADYLGSSHAIFLWVDPNHGGLLDAMSRVHEGIPPALFGLWLPHECALACGAGDGGGEDVEVVFAASLRRFAGFLGMFRSDPQRWRWFAAQEMTSARVERPGLWVVRSRVKPEPAPAGVPPPGAPVRFDGTHAAELLIDNRDGVAAAVLHRLFEPAHTVGEASVASEGWLDLLQHVRTARFVSDLEGSDAVRVLVSVECQDSGAASVVMTFLNAHQLEMEQVLAESSVAAEGAWTQRGPRIEGHWRLRGASYAFARLIRYHRV